MSIIAIRAAFAHGAFTGLSPKHLSLLLTELQPAWTAAREDRLYEPRQPASASRSPPPPPFDLHRPGRDHPGPTRSGHPHAALAVAYGVFRAAVTRAVTQIRLLLARRGFATPAGVRLHTLADVFAYAAAESVTLRHRDPGAPAPAAASRVHRATRHEPEPSGAAAHASPAPQRPPTPRPKEYRGQLRLARR